MSCRCGRTMKEHQIAGGCLAPLCPCQRFQLPANGPIFRKKELPLSRREMSPREKYAAEQLSRCRFLPGTSDKRFALQVCDMTHATERQIWNLWRLVFRFRRQIADKYLISEAERILNGRPVDKT